MPEAFSKIRQPSGIEIDRDRLSEFGFAGSLVGERQKLDRHLAGAPVITMFPQGVEQTFVSCAREELVAIESRRRGQDLAAGRASLAR